MTINQSRIQKLARLEKTFNLEVPDHPPILGGWLAAPEHIQAITGCSEEEYWQEPFRWGVAAEQTLGSDAIVTIIEPLQRGDFRIVDGQVLEERAAYTIDKLLDEIESLPSPEEQNAAFDEDAAYQAFADEFKQKQAACGDVVWMPADWYLIPKALWYIEYGYETAMITLAQHPDEYRKLIQFSAERGRQHAIVRARAIQEGWCPSAIFTGEDLCDQRGPMVSPWFLRREYFPLIEYALEPLLAIDAKIIWHCDGNYNPILDDVLACGVAGLQGFQRECGMFLEDLVQRRTRKGNRLIIMGAMSVTTTLPFGSTDDVRAEVQRTMDICRDQASLICFTSNTINPDVPLENIRAFWDEVQNSHW